MKAIINGKIIKGDQVLTGYVLLFDEEIKDIIPKEQFQNENCEEVIDAKGDYVSPGFLNLHIHGCAGSDVMDDAEKNIRMMRQNLVKTGVTAFLPTTMTYDFARIHKAFEKLRQAMQVNDGARVLGANVEGPFINVEYKGAHDPQYIVKPEFDLIKDYTDVIRIMTVAPELIEDQSFIDKCKDNNIILSLGHSAATYDQAVDAIQNGFSHITHMYNAMPVFNHRKPGVIGAAMDTNAMCEIITDNIHVHPAMQRILLKQKGLDKVVLVTDSMKACMLSDGEYELGGQDVIVENKTAKLKNGVIAGSVLTMDQAVYNFKNNTGISIQDVVKMVTENPAKELKLYHELGSLEVGKKADITIFNDKIEIATTLVNGEVVYGRK